LRCCKTRVSKEARTEETVAEASIGAAKEFEGIPGKPYRVDTGPNAAKERVRENMAPLSRTGALLPELIGKLIGIDEAISV
jgi:hypothetical protein